MLRRTNQYIVKGRSPDGDRRGVFRTAETWHVDRANVTRSRIVKNDPVKTEPRLRTPIDHSDRLEGAQRWSR